MVVLVVGIALSLSSLSLAGDFPEWLGGKPDLDRRSDRCGVYEWFFNEADSQTAGTASTDDLAAICLINIANKLVDHHLSSPAESYGAEIKFLVVGRDHGPFHFEFNINNAELERIMNKSCGE
jgi:hypothetical protein